MWLMVVKFSRYQFGPSIYNIMTSKGKEQEKAIEDSLEVLKVFEEGIERDFPAKSPFLNGGTLGFLDIVVGSSSCNFKAFNEVFAVVFDPEKNPAFCSWVTAMKECPLMKETLPPHDRLVAKISKLFLQPPNAWILWERLSSFYFLLWNKDMSAVVLMDLYMSGYYINEIIKVW